MEMGAEISSHPERACDLGEAPQATERGEECRSFCGRSGRKPDRTLSRSEAVFYHGSCKDPELLVLRLPCPSLHYPSRFDPTRRSVSPPNVKRQPKLFFFFLPVRTWTCFHRDSRNNGNGIFYRPVNLPISGDVHTFQFSTRYFMAVRSMAVARRGRRNLRYFYCRGVRAWMGPNR